jgi:collagenase-like PrtC family protease
MYLTIPTTFEDKFLSEILKLQKKYENSDFKIKELQGALPVSCIGSGRNKWDLPQINIEILKHHIEKIKKAGFEFCYLLNASCLGNIEYTFSGRKKIINFLNLLVETGVDVVTVTVPFLVEFIRERYPQLKINTSVYSNIDSLEKAIFFEKLGANRITLDPNINRNFPLLKKIREKIKIDLQILVNTSCLFSCPQRYYHANVTGHFSTDTNLDFFPAFSFNERCMLIRLQNPAEFIKTPWIRPEDLSIYKEIGINYFKIAGREYPAKKILKQVEAYLSGTYKGNLAEVLMGFFDSYKFKKPLDFYIDNEKLENFLDFFLKSPDFPCKDGCTDCKYCEKFAEKVVKIDKEIQEEYLKIFSEKLKERLYIEEKDRLSSLLEKSRVSRNIFLKVIEKLYYAFWKK